MINAKRYAILALGVFALDKIAISILNIFRKVIPLSLRLIALNTTIVIFNWLLPLARALAVTEEALITVL